MDKYKIMKFFSQFLFVIIVFIFLFLMLIKFDVITLTSSELPLAIVLNHDTIGMKLESNYQIEASVYPKNVHYGEIKWSSSNPSVVSVNETTGYMEAHKEGTAFIKANVSLNNLETECMVEVSKDDILVKKINLSNEEINLLKGDSYKIGYTLSPSNATTHKFDYISSDTSVVVVNEKGIIKAVNSGIAIVTVKSRINNVSDNIIVNVYNYENDTLNNNDGYVNNGINFKSQKLSLSSNILELGVGITSKLASIVTPVNASQKVNWFSTNTNIVTISKDGIIVGIKEGKAKIVATTIDGISSVCEVVVTKNNNFDNVIEIVDDVIEMNVLENKSLNYNLYLSNTNSSTIKWTSSNEKVVKVNNGVITALSKGEANVKVSTSNGKYYDSIKVKVNDNVNDKIKIESIFFSNNLKNAKVNDTINLIPNVLPLNANNYSISWSTSNSNIAIVDKGVVKCLKEGSVIITATSGSIKASVEIIVGNVYPSLITIEENDYISISLNESRYLVKQIVPSNSTNQDVKWLSSNTSIVSVNEYGLIKGLKKGQAIITVKTVNDKSYSVNVTVS